MNFKQPLTIPFWEKILYFVFYNILSNSKTTHMGFAKEFKEFAIKGNVMDLAVGVVIGGAFGKIVSALVADIVMPLVNPIIPGGDWRAIEIGPKIKIGDFAGTILDFVIVALAIFLVVKGINAMKKQEAVAPTLPLEPSSTDKLLMEIRDSLKK
jgi:large conductance mechanosensitive channel